MDFVCFFFCFVVVLNCFCLGFSVDFEKKVWIKDLRTDDFAQNIFEQKYGHENE